MLKRFWFRNLEKKIYWEYLDVDGSIRFKLILKEWSRRA